jgi:hypothetical protein
MRRAVAPPGYPPVRVSGQQQYIVDGSPLAIIGMYVSILRERFSEADSPRRDTWVWQDDPTASTITIESALEDNSTLRNKQPAIFVDKDQSIYGKSVVGDRAHHQMRNSQDVQWALSTVPVIIECVATRRGESAILGDIVQWTLHAASDVIQKTFGLHDMSPPTLGRTIPYEMDSECWNTPINFQVQYNVVWTYVPIKPLLQQIAVRIEAAGTTANDYFTEVVMQRKS